MPDTPEPPLLGRTTDQLARALFSLLTELVLRRQLSYALNEIAHMGVGGAEIIDKMAAHFAETGD